MRLKTLFPALLVVFALVAAPVFAEDKPAPDKPADDGIVMWLNDLQSDEVAERIAALASPSPQAGLT